MRCPGLVWTALPDGRAEFINQRWCDYTGLTLEQATGLRMADRDPSGRSAAGSSNAGGPSSSSAKPARCEARLRRHDGEYRRFLFSAAPITDESGQVVKWCGINTDIEERLKAEERAHAIAAIPSEGRRAPASRCAPCRSAETERDRQLRLGS